FPILSLLFGWMGSSFLAIHQANALALWFWPVFFAVLFQPAERGRDVVLLLVLALPMVGLYDTIVVLGPLLAAVAGCRWLRLPAGLAILVLVGEARGWRPSEATRSSLLLVLSLIAVAQITWHFVATAQWAGYLAIFRATLAERPGLVAFESTPMAQPAIGNQVLLHLTWGWTNPWLSVALAPHGRVSAIIA